MSKPIPEIDSDLAAWIARQRIFFVATAPLSPTAHINISPKGGDSFRVLGPMTVAYQDYTGSGIETTAHLRENHRIVIMFCAFEGPPKVVRLHGRGETITSAHPRFTELTSKFPFNPGARSIIHVELDRVSSSCGYSVPFFNFQSERDALDRWAENQGPEKLLAYRAQKNQKSIDNLPGLQL
jgi:hypothetical protein